jgi:hypothetical protein
MRTRLDIRCGSRTGCDDVTECECGADGAGGALPVSGLTRRRTRTHPESGHRLAVNRADAGEARRGQAIWRLGCVWLATVSNPWRIEPFSGQFRTDTLSRGPMARRHREKVRGGKAFGGSITARRASLERVEHSLSFPIEKPERKCHNDAIFAWHGRANRSRWNRGMGQARMPWPLRDSGCRSGRRAKRSSKKYGRTNGCSQISSGRPRPSRMDP